MKYNICSIALSLFWWFPVVLDLDTGKTYTLYRTSVVLEVEKLKSPKRIPHYSAAPIYRCYLELAQDLGIVDAGDLLERFPRFEFTGETGAVGVPFGDSDEEKAFYRETDILFDSMWGDSRILPLDDFLEEFKICAAKRWCAQEGIEWYDRRPQSRRHTLPDAVEKTLKFLTVPEGLQ